MGAVARTETVEDPELVSIGFYAGRCMTRVYPYILRLWYVVRPASGVFHHIARGLPLFNLKPVQKRMCPRPVPPVILVAAMMADAL